MELVSMLKSTAAVWEHFGFKPNDRGEPLHLDEPVGHICCKTEATKSGKTTNMHLHLKHRHLMQVSRTNCLGEHTCHKQQLQNCTAKDDMLKGQRYCFWLCRDRESFLFIVSGCSVYSFWIFKMSSSHSNSNSKYSLEIKVY